jgi:hypothetical protein
MENMPKAISQAGNLDDLFPILELMSRELVRIINAKRVVAGEVQNIAGYLTDIRLLLNELSHREITPDGTGATAPSDKRGAVRYLELEEKMKEIGNDLDLALKRVSA